MLFTLKSEDVRKIIILFNDAKTPVSQIGEVTAHPQKVVLLQNDGKSKSLKKLLGFDHFRTESKLEKR